VPHYGESQQRQSIKGVHRDKGRDKGREKERDRGGERVLSTESQLRINQQYIYQSTLSLENSKIRSELPRFVLHPSSTHDSASIPPQFLLDSSSIQPRLRFVQLAIFDSSTALKTLSLGNMHARFILHRPILYCIRYFILYSFSIQVCPVWTYLTHYQL
jgi:hypothetical protein